MTITTLISDVSYNGDASTLIFPFLFKVIDATHLYVTIDGIAVLQADATYPWTPTGIGDDAGGSVVFSSTPPPTGVDNVLIYRDVPSTQEIDYTPFDAFPAESHENALDKLTMLVQEASTVSNRALRYPVGDNADVVLPSAELRALKFLSFDVSGNVTVIDDPSVIYSMEWAIKPEDSLISVDAGGDGVNDYSSLHWAAKSEDQVALAEAVYETFDDRYLGSKVSNPTTLNDGTTALNASHEGIEFWDSTLNVRKTWTGSAWILTTSTVASNAVDVLISDAGGYYAGADVEAALQALRPKSGLWTPTCEGRTVAGTGWTYAFQYGLWSQVGNLMFLSFEIRITTVGAGAVGTIQIAGLPSFTADISDGNLIRAGWLNACENISLDVGFVQYAVVYDDTVGIKALNVTELGRASAVPPQGISVANMTATANIYGSVIIPLV